MITSFTALSLAAMISLPGLAPAIALDPAPPPAHRVDQERLIAGLRALPIARAALGDVEHQQGLADTERLIEERLKEMGYTPILEPLRWNIQKQIEHEEKLAENGAVQPRQMPDTIDELANRTWHNIIVELPGTDLPEEVLVIGAHFDAVPGTPGADDNATGAAALLELAHVLKDVPMRRTVRLVFFNLEEIGLRGAADHVRARRDAWQSGEETMIGMVSLEMLGYFSDEPGSQRSPVPPIEGVFEPPTVGDFIAIATVRRHQEFSQRFGREMQNAQPELKVLIADFFPIAPPDLLRSDHAPFMMAGLPAVILTDTSEFRNPHYHKPSDTIETLDLHRYTMVVRAVAGAVHAIAGPAGDQSDTIDNLAVP
jgi:hypothetical protein